MCVVYFIVFNMQYFFFVVVNIPVYWGSHLYASFLPLHFWRGSWGGLQSPTAERNLCTCVPEVLGYGLIELMT